MDWGKLLELVSGQGLALVVGAIAVWVSYRAIRVTRANQDPVFVMECDPVDWQAYDWSNGVKEQVPLVLINKGNGSPRTSRGALTSIPSTWRPKSSRGHSSRETAAASRSCPYLSRTT